MGQRSKNISRLPSIFLILFKPDAISLHSCLFFCSSIVWLQTANTSFCILLSNQIAWSVNSVVTNITYFQICLLCDTVNLAKHIPKSNFKQIYICSITPLSSNHDTWSMICNYTPSSNYSYRDKCSSSLTIPWQVRTHSTQVLVNPPWIYYLLKTS